MEQPIRITPPLDDEVVRSLRAGEPVEINGVLYAARDAAHRRLIELIEAGRPLPFDPAGQIIYYVGPTPARPGQIIGSAGPTTSMRMNAYAPRLLELGLKGIIGKGQLGEETAAALQRFTGVYFAAVGGAGALIARWIRSSRIVAFEDLGTEALRELRVEGFQAVTAQDCFGGNLFAEGRRAFALNG